MLKLVEECAGVGDLSANGEIIRRVRYRIVRYQGISEGLHGIRSKSSSGSSLPKCS